MSIRGVLFRIAHSADLTGLSLGVDLAGWSRPMREKRESKRGKEGELNQKLPPPDCGNQTDSSPDTGVVVHWPEENNPKPYYGKDLHQWLTEQYGLRKLVQHIYTLIGVAKTCYNMGELRRQDGRDLRTSPSADDSAPTAASIPTSSYLLSVASLTIRTAAWLKSSRAFFP
jgi:hypothetical protein